MPNSHQAKPEAWPHYRFEGGVQRGRDPQITISQAPGRRAAFQPLPAPTGKPPYHLSLDQVLPAQAVAAIQKAGQLVFHTAGDTGGVKAPEAQTIVAMKMVEQFAVTPPTNQPQFFYHLGDVIYYYGEAQNYYPQFYEPYIHYAAPILAIPGNHDGDVPKNSTEPSLAAFVENFCATTMHLSPEAEESGRPTMIQPNVYWTLEAPFVTIMGLYTNVPEGGELEQTQKDWLVSELKNAPADKALLLAMHHPIYSADDHHSGSAYMEQVLQDAVQAAGRMPDAVFAGHVHNYQRFTRVTNNREVPYIVAGAGGYWHLHYEQSLPQPPPYRLPGTEVTLENYVDSRHGFMRVTVDAQTLKGEYFTVPRPQESWRHPAALVDTFSLDLKTHQLARRR